MKPIILPALCVLVASCSGVAEPAEQNPLTTSAPEPVVRVILVGDIMTGRGLARIMDAEPDEVFAGVRHLLSGADVAAGNLESPLTLRPHLSPNENSLEADPRSAAVLASAGFDLLSLPNNHSMDAGPEGLLDTIASIDSVGMVSVGAGATQTAAEEPAIRTVGETTIGFLAFDATGVGTTASTGPGVASWDPTAASAAVRAVREMADVVIVSVHGGTEYLPVTDPGMAEIATELVAAGADVVWGHGAHVVQPVSLISGDRSAVVATSLGNFLFDQSGRDRTTGYLLEVMVDDQGVVAYRVAVSEHPDRLVEFVEWLEPVGDAGWAQGSWLSLARPLSVTPSTAVAVDAFRHGDLVAAARGDIDGDGKPDLVASFRRPHQMTTFMETRPEVQWADSEGRDAHLGVYAADTLNEVWVAGSVLLPILILEVCDGSLAIIHDELDDPTPISAGAWTWNGFGFDTAPDLPGGGLPRCADFDGDGETDPVILGR